MLLEVYVTGSARIPYVRFTVECNKHNGWNIYKIAKKSVNFLSACFTMTESDSSKSYGSIMIPKAREIRKSLFRISTPKEREDLSISLPYVGQAVRYCFFLTFSLSP